MAAPKKETPKKEEATGAAKCFPETGGAARSKEDPSRSAWVATDDFSPRS
jgi:hypothetical protein